jgi:hypothetical protein
MFRRIMAGRAPFWLGCAILVLTAGSVRSTSISWTKATCPVCGKHFQARVVNSTNNFEGQDPDLLEHASGADAFLYLIWECPRCRYAGTSGLFDKDVEIDNSLKAQIKDGRFVREAVADPNAGLGERTWGYHSALRTIRFLHADSLAIAMLALRAAWVIRDRASITDCLDSLTSARLFTRLDTLEQRAFRLGGNRSAACIAVGRAAIRELDTLADSNWAPTALAAIYLLQKHGEMGDCELVLPRLSQHMPAVDFNRFKDTLTQFFADERYYMVMSLNALKCVPPGPRADSMVPAAVRSYLCGELARHLGKPLEAIGYYEAAKGMPGIDSTLLGFISTQTEVAKEMSGKQ